MFDSAQVYKSLLRHNGRHKQIIQLYNCFSYGVNRFRSFSFQMIQYFTLWFEKKSNTLTISLLLTSTSMTTPADGGKTSCWYGFEVTLVTRPAVLFTCIVMKYSLL